jgi:hypothetical protein
MHKQIVVSLLFFGLCAASVSAQTATLPDHFGSWAAEGPVRNLRLQDLGNNWVQGTNGDKVLAESGVKHIEQRAYRSGNKAKVQAFRARQRAASS